VNDGEWHHISGIVDREQNEARIYIDGQLQEIELPLDQATADVKAIGDITNSNNLAFGSDDQQVRELVEGSYDELRIWSRPLTDGEIQQAAKGGMPGAAVQPNGKLATTWVGLKYRR
jgi:hypothetical protein